MPFPRNSDGSLDWATYRTFDENAQEEAENDLQRTGTPTEHKEAFNYFDRQANALMELKRQNNEMKGVLHAKILDAERREAKHTQDLNHTIKTNLKNSPNNRKKNCSIS